MNPAEYLEGVCCEYCIKFETDDCPVKSASPWSRWDYCNHFRNDRNQSVVDFINKEKK